MGIINYLTDWLPNPKLLITLFKERNELEEKRRSEPSRFNGMPESYGAKTTAEKTLFFYHYLTFQARQNHTDGKPPADFLYKLAYIMANHVYGSSVKFGNYPDIFDEEKNIVLKYVSKINFDEISNITLSALLVEEILDIEKSLYDEARP